MTTARNSGRVRITGYILRDGSGTWNKSCFDKPKRMLSKWDKEVIVRPVTLSRYYLSY